MATPTGIGQLPGYLRRPKGRSMIKEPFGRPMPHKVQIHWLSFLDIPDLAKACAVCKAFLVMVNKLYSQEFAETTGADAPQMMPRIDKLNLLRRIRKPLAPESMPYLLTMAAGRTEFLPYMHHLLLLREQARLQLGLSGGLFGANLTSSASQLSPNFQPLFSYKGGQGYDIEWGHTTPLCRAADTGNADAVHLLLLFGEEPNIRNKERERPLLLACRQGNIRTVEALLGRVLLRPPLYPVHVAQNLDLVREVEPNAGNHKEWLEQGSQPAYSVGGQSDQNGSIKEQRIARAKSDKRYFAWSRGYDCGLYWSVHDVSAPVESNERPNIQEHNRLKRLGFGESIFRHRPTDNGGQAQAYDDTEPGPPAIEGVEIRPEQEEENQVPDLTDALAQLQDQLQEEAAQRSSRGGAGERNDEQDEDGYLDSSLQVERTKGRVQCIHPRIPDPIDYGRIAAAVVGVRIRLNVMDKEGDTPLLSAVRKGHVAIACLLLSHHDPSLLFTGKIPRGMPPSDPREFQQWKHKAMEETLSERGSTPALPGSEVGLPGEIGAPGSAIPMPDGYESYITETRDRCDPDLSPGSDYPPLCVAASRGDTRAVQLLLHFGADVNKQGKKDQNPLLCAVLANQEHLLPVFLCCCLPQETASRVEAAIEKIRVKRKEKFQKHVDENGNDADAEYEYGDEEEEKEEIATSMQDALAAMNGDWVDLSLPAAKPGYFGNLNLPEGLSDTSIWPQGVREKGIGGIFSTWNMKLQEPVINTCSVSIRGAESEAAGGIDLWKSRQQNPNLAVLNSAVERWYVRQHHVSQACDTVIAKSPILQHVGVVDDRVPIRVDLEDESGFTPLHIAAEKGKIDSVKLLMAAGADHTHCTMRGKSVIYAAVERGHIGTINAILPFCTVYQLRQKTKYGTDVVFMANKSGNKQVKDLLNEWVEKEEHREARRLEEELQRRRWGKKKERVKVQHTIMQKLMQGQHKEEVESGFSRGSTDNNTQKQRRSKSEGHRRRQRRSRTSDNSQQAEGVEVAGSGEKN
eukprot:gb/GECG01006119.1/.p1 GENE.gb/GECG01006119.1/~~gb/GECG01006119.1/.p1  ORF type:complete len:1025 (+),score=125.57 gb/GECG01006119.1/:1-3075(+)